MIDLHERVAALEARMDMDFDDRAIRRAELDHTLHELKNSLDKISSEISRYKGLVGGISLALSLMWAGIVFFKDAIRNALQR